MYYSNRDPSITRNPRKTNCKHVEEFVKATCTFYFGASTITEDAYDKYKRFCHDRGYEDIAVFNSFARSFRFLLTNSDIAISGIGVIPVNYMAYKEGVGYVNKSGWSYQNLTINY